MIAHQQPTPETRSASLQQNRSFLLFWGGQSLSSVGNGMSFVAYPLLVFATARSVQVMGLATALMGLGSFCAGLISGVLADRFDRRVLLLLCDACSAAGYTVIPLYWHFLGPQVGLLLVLAFPLEFASLAATVASTASLPQLVEPAHLVSANARLQVSNALGFVCGPILAGLLIGVFGSALVALTLNALSYLASVLSLLLIRLRPVGSGDAAATTRPHWWSTWLAGARFLWQHPLLLWIVLLRIGEMLCLAGSYDLVVFRVRQELGQPAVAVGIMWGVGTFGAIAGGVLAPRVRRWLGFGVPFLGGLALQGLSFLAVGWLSNLWFLVACGIGVTFGDILVIVLGQTALQESTPDTLQGRVTAAMQAGIWLATAVGAAASTSLAAMLGSTTPVFAVIGLLLLALAGVGVLTPASSRLSEPPISLSQSAG